MFVFVYTTAASNIYIYNIKQYSSPLDARGTIHYRHSPLGELINRPTMLTQSTSIRLVCPIVPSKVDKCWLQIQYRSANQLMQRLRSLFAYSSYNYCTLCNAVFQLGLFPRASRQALTVLRPARTPFRPIDVHSTLPELKNNFFLHLSAFVFSES